MARIPPLTDDGGHDEVRLLFDGARKLTGRVSNFYRTLAHSPRIPLWLLPFSVTAQRMGPGTSLDGRLRELVIIKTSLINACKY